MVIKQSRRLDLVGLVSLTLMSATPAPAAEGRISCIAALGAVAATRLQEACKGVSPATHPPCGAMNSCALVKDEIARSCALIGADVARTTPACRLAPLDPAGVLRRYYEAIDARDYDTAFAMLKPDGRGTPSLAAFSAGFAHTAATRVVPGMPSAVVGAAGSSFVTVPVTVEATLLDGTHQRFTGRYVLRATGPQGPVTDTRWFILSADLRPTKF